MKNLPFSVRKVEVDNIRAVRQNGFITTHCFSRNGYACLTNFYYLFTIKYAPQIKPNN